jgi:antirestriction protein
MSVTATDVEPALYCGTYAKYNDGSIAGRWLKLRDHPDAGAFLQACRQLHRDEADPELMFQDYEGLPRDFYSESLSLADLQRIYTWVNLPDDDRELVTEYVDATGYSMDDVDVEAVRDNLVCVLDRSDGRSDDAAMGWHAIDNGLLGVDIPDSLQSYIDVEAVGRDWLMDLQVSPNGYVFEA